MRTGKKKRFWGRKEHKWQRKMRRLDKGRSKSWDRKVKKKWKQDDMRIGDRKGKTVRQEIAVVGNS